MTVLLIALFVFWVFFPMTILRHTTWVYTIDKVIGTKGWQTAVSLSTYLVYPILMVYTAYLSLGTDESFFGYSLVERIGVSVFTSMLLFVLLMLYTSFILFSLENLEDKQEKRIESTVMRYMIKRMYSTDIASLFDFFRQKGVLLYGEHGEDVYVLANDEVVYPRGHDDLGESLARLNNLLIKHRTNPVMRAIIKDAFVREERINRIAFVLSVFEDERKLRLLSEEKHDDYDAYFYVFNDIVLDLVAEVKAYNKLQEKTQQSQEDMEKMALRQEIDSLKRSSDALSFAGNARKG